MGARINIKLCLLNMKIFKWFGDLNRYSGQPYKLSCTNKLLDVILLEIKFVNKTYLEIICLEIIV